MLQVYTALAEDSPIVITKGQITIDKSPEDCFRAISHVERFSTMFSFVDPMSRSPTVLERYDAKHILVYCMFKVQWSDYTPLHRVGRF